MMKFTLEGTAKYTFEQHICLYNSYVKKISYNLCKRSFCSVLVLVFQLHKQILNS
jgi:hypothetical protein